jgi:hypothetical protein
MRIGTQHRSAEMQVSSETRIAATRAGYTRESFGQEMNLARRFEQLGLLSDAARCANRALAVLEKFPHLVCEGRPLPEALRANVTRLAGLA